MDKKIANRLKRHGFDEWGIHILTPIIKSLLKEYAMEIIGEDTKFPDFVSEHLKRVVWQVYKTTEIDWTNMKIAATIRENQLKAEQREKLLTEDKNH